MIEIEAVKDALGEIERIGKPHNGPTRSTGDEDIVAPGGLAIAAELGISAEQANQLGLVFVHHIGGGYPLWMIREDPKLASLAIGMFFGYLTRLLEERDADPTEVIRNQVIGYLKGKASVRRDEEPNTPTSDARSQLNKEATMLELAAEALEGEVENNTTKGDQVEISVGKDKIAEAVREVQADGNLTVIGWSDGCISVAEVDGEGRTEEIKPTDLLPGASTGEESDAADEAEKASQEADATAGGGESPASEEPTPPAAPDPAPGS